MHAGREAAISRVVTLMTPTEKSNLDAKAKGAGLSVGELVRRSVDAYDPLEIQQLEQLAELAREFRLSAERASAAVDRASARVRETVEYLQRKRTK